MAVFKIKRFNFLGGLFGSKKKNEEPIKNVDKDFNMKIEDVFSITGKGIIVTGKIISGRLDLYDNIKIKDTGNCYVVTEITQFRKTLDSAGVGDNVGLLLRLANKDDIKRDMIIISPDSN